jgi:bisphosphoglycerate-independent phosphoglycerate mutase (AlkP superfamily)
MYKVPHKILKAIKDNISSSKILIELLSKGSKVDPKQIKSTIKKLEKDLKILNQYDIDGGI